MGISLITIIGRGTFKDDRYEKTQYIFPDGSQSNETTLFSKALLERYKGNLDSIVIAGTETSSWSAILPDDRSDEELMELLLKLYQQEKENKAISDEDLKKIKEWLMILYKCDVHILPPQKSNISEEENAISVYSHVSSYVKEGAKIIFDITSGFRYMPLLIFQNLQIHSDDIKFSNVELIYAELKGSKAFVRDVSSVWKAAEVTKDLHVFKSSFNGQSLSRIVKTYGYPHLSEWIEEFTDNIQKNYVMSCDREFFARLRNILIKEVGDINLVQSSIIKETALFLKEEVVEKFNFEEKRLSHYLYVFSSILNKRNLFTQAIIALKEGLYTRIFENHDPHQISVYIDEKELKNRSYYNEFMSNISHNTKYYTQIEDLKKLRNSIAHAGEDKNKKKLPLDFEYYYEAVSEVFRRIEK